MYRSALENQTQTTRVEHLAVQLLCALPTGSKQTSVVISLYQAHSRSNHGILGRVTTLVVHFEVHEAHRFVYNII